MSITDCKALQKYPGWHCPVAWSIQPRIPWEAQVDAWRVSAIWYSFTTRWEHRLLSLCFEVVFFQPWKLLFPLGSCYKLAGGLNLPPSLRSTLTLTLVPRGHPSRLMPCMTSIQSGTCCLGWKHIVTPQVLRDVLGITRMFRQACFMAYFFNGKWSMCSLLVVLKSLWSPEKSAGKRRDRLDFWGPKTSGGAAVVSRQMHRNKEKPYRLAQLQDTRSDPYSCQGASKALLELFRDQMLKQGHDPVHVCHQEDLHPGACLSLCASDSRGSVWFKYPLPSPGHVCNARTQ